MSRHPHDLTAPTPARPAAVETVNRAVEDTAWGLICALTASQADLPPSYRAAATRLLDDAIGLLYRAAPYIDGEPEARAGSTS